MFINSVCFHNNQLISRWERNDKQMFKLFATQEQEEEQIFERLDVILRRLSVIVRPEKQVQLPLHYQTQDNLLCQLPSELIYLIVLKLPLFDYWRFRATCKMFGKLHSPQNLNGESPYSSPFRIMLDHMKSKIRFKLIHVLEPSLVM